MSIKKKIVIVGPAYPYRGGNSLFVSHVYDALAPDFEVRLFNYKLLYPKLLFPGTTQFDRSGVQIKKAPNERIINSINPFNWISAAQRIKKENADLVVFDWWHPFFGPCHFAISSLIKNKYKGKILFITENYVSHEGNLPDRILTKVGLSNASSFLSLSDKVEKELKEAGNNKKVYRSELPVYDCYAGNESDNSIAKQNLGFHPDDKVLLFFGYVRKYKGLDILIEAFADLVKELKNVKLLIVGEFYDKPEVYLDLLKKYDIEDKVKVVNEFVPNEEVGKYYSACDLNILPYRSATQSGILNVSYGFLKPVLVTDVGGLAESVIDKKTGLIVAPESKEELLKGIKEFFSLKDSIDFESNIREFIGHNKFEDLPELFDQIITETE